MIVARVTIHAAAGASVRLLTSDVALHLEHRRYILVTYLSQTSQTLQDLNRSLQNIIISTFTILPNFEFRIGRSQQHLSQCNGVVHATSRTWRNQIRCFLYDGLEK